MRIVFVVAALLMTGCAGWKVGGGYSFDSKQFFFKLEKPLNGFDK